jgi:hypothetical protein
MAIPVINIGSKLDGKGFKQAETALGKLSGSAKKLAGSLGLAFGTAAVVAFGKKSIKAFADSESEATRLRIAVSNLGLAFAAPEIDRYIDKIELATGVNRDQLQPAFLTLLQTTGSLTKSQELLNLSLDVSAATGADASSVAEKLSQAYLGNTKGLKTLNLGLTTAELNSANFETIQEKITKLFAGQGQAAADSYTGQINKLAIASEQASEIIGGGLVDSLLILSGNTDVSALADDMLTAAYNTAEFTRSVTELAKAINAPVKGLAEIVARFVKATDPFVDLIIEGDPSGFLTKKPPLASSAPLTGFNGKTFYADAEKNAKALAKAEAEAKKRAAELLKIKNKQLESERKSLAAKKLAAAIDKANLLLNKGEEIFDLEKIQIGAALTNQADQLGKITNQSQMLAIANDVARLNVKKSMLELEDAIAAKDEAAIIAATAKLNADLKILGALNGQSLKLVDIKSIIDSLKPKDLINITNLNEALAKIQEMLRLLAQANAAATAKLPTSASLGSGIPYTNITNLVSNTGVVAANTPGVGTARASLAATGYGGDKAIFGFGRVGSPSVMTNIANLVSNTGVVATDTPGVGTARRDASAAGYGGDKAIFGFGSILSPSPTAWVAITNLVSNTGVVAANTPGVTLGKAGLGAAGYGGDKAIFGFGGGPGYPSPFAANITNLVSNTGVVATDTPCVGTARSNLAAAGYSST